MPDDDRPGIDEDDIRRRAEAATPGLVRGVGDAASHYHGGYAVIAPAGGHKGQRAVWCTFNIHFDHEADAELFVHARADVLALLAGLADAGRAEVRRASHVEPTPDARWNADLAPSGGPVLGPFRLHGEAVDAEREWLVKHELKAGE